MTKKTILLGCLFAGTAVILGAMGAHALKPLLGPEQLQSFETAVRYQMYHGLALLLLAALGDKLQVKFSNYAYIAFTFGVLFFSGSLYLLSLRNLIGIENFKWLGPITPLGGLCFIGGWIFLGIAALKSNK